MTPQTKIVRLSAQVTSRSYRNPALLARIIAALDIASNGRMDLGIGAGWKKSEYESFGYPFPSVKTRILQLLEVLHCRKTCGLGLLRMAIPERRDKIKIHQERMERATSSVGLDALAEILSYVQQSWISKLF